MHVFIKVATICLASYCITYTTTYDHVLWQAARTFGSINSIIFITVTSLTNLIRETSVLNQNYHMHLSCNSPLASLYKLLFRANIHSYYGSIMLDAFRYLLCSKLCWHNQLVQSLGYCHLLPHVLCKLQKHQKRYSKNSFISDLEVQLCRYIRRQLSIVRTT